nr:MAG: capsid protein [Cressdnaviricota sp.]
MKSGKSRKSKSFRRTKSKFSSKASGIDKFSKTFTITFNHPPALLQNTIQVNSVPNPSTAQTAIDAAVWANPSTYNANGIWGTSYSATTATLIPTVYNTDVSSLGTVSLPGEPYYGMMYPLRFPLGMLQAYHNELFGTYTYFKLNRVTFKFSRRANWQSNTIQPYNIIISGKHPDPILSLETMRKLPGTHSVKLKPGRHVSISFKPIAYQPTHYNTDGYYPGTTATSGTLTNVAMIHLSSVELVDKSRRAPVRYFPCSILKKLGVLNPTGTPATPQAVYDGNARLQLNNFIFSGPFVCLQTNWLPWSAANATSGAYQLLSNPPAYGIAQSPFSTSTGTLGTGFGNLSTVVDFQDIKVSISASVSFKGLLDKEFQCNPLTFTSWPGGLGITTPHTTWEFANAATTYTTGGATSFPEYGSYTGWTVNPSNYSIPFNMVNTDCIGNTTDAFGGVNTISPDVVACFPNTNANPSDFQEPRMAS